jgi:hypothetical protein
MADTHYEERHADHSADLAWGTPQTHRVGIGGGLFREQWMEAREVHADRWVIGTWLIWHA